MSAIRACPRLFGAEGPEAAVAEARHEFDGSTTQGWIVALLDGGKEGIHVDVDDLANALKRDCDAEPGTILTRRRSFLTQNAIAS